MQGAPEVPAVAEEAVVGPVDEGGAGPPSETASQYIARSERQKTGMARMRFVTKRSILSESDAPFTRFAFFTTHSATSFWMKS